MATPATDSAQEPPPPPAPDESAVPSSQQSNNKRAPTQQSRLGVFFKAVSREEAARKGTQELQRMGEAATGTGPILPAESVVSPSTLRVRRYRRKRKAAKMMELQRENQELREQLAAAQNAGANAEAVSDFIDNTNTIQNFIC